MVNAAYDAIHAVRKDNVVIAGGQSPFGPDADSPDRVAPLTMMRMLLCLSAGRKTETGLQETCEVRRLGPPPLHVRRPTAPCQRQERRLASGSVEDEGPPRCGSEVGEPREPRPVSFWVTEFAWDTSPPDPKGSLSELHGRWVAEALYRMWDQG